MGRQFVDEVQIILPPVVLTPLPNHSARDRVHDFRVKGALVGEFVERPEEDLGGSVDLFYTQKVLRRITPQLLCQPEKLLAYSPVLDIVFERSGDFPEYSATAWRR